MDRSSGGNMASFGRMKGRALITGASSGIGKELAFLFARGGHDLVLTARRAGLLEELAAALRRRHGIDVRVIPADLSKPGSAAALSRELDASGLGIEFLVNNAGAGILGAFAETGLDAEKDMMHLHMTSVVELSKLLLGPMLAKGAGRILNVASTAGFQPGPGMAVYYASKAFLISFSEAVRDELRNTGVTVTVLCPGPTRSGFLGAMGVAEPALVKALSMSSGRAAVAGYRAMMKGRRMAVPGLLNRLGVQVLRLSPRGLVARVVGLLQVVRKGP
jgi:uncharacterized protein